MRKRFTLSMVAAAIFAFSGVFASMAAADQPLDVLDDGPYSEGLCPEVIYEYNEVSGGCEVEAAEGGFNFNWGFLQSPSWGSYTMNFDFRVDGHGTALAYNQDIDSQWPPFYGPCDEGEGSLPWPIQFWVNDGYEVEAEMTVQMHVDGSSSACTSFTVPFDMKLLHDGGGDLAQNEVVQRVKNAEWEFDGKSALEFNF